MSDNIIKENFKDFYEELKPLIGGGYLNISNKFDKSNIYSTQEKMIGQWIDGKPLYQKTIDISSTFVSAAKDTNHVKSQDHNISNIDNIINYFGIKIYDENGTAQVLPSYEFIQGADYGGFIFFNKEKIHIETHQGDSSYNIAYVTVQYTKTTDEAIEIGSDTDYSLEEKIIGTWINNKPLYQKTIVVPITVANTAAFNFVNHNIQNINTNTVHKIECICTRTNGSWVYPLGSSPSGNWHATVNNEEVGVYTTDTNCINSTAYVTLQYTKTTD